MVREADPARRGFALHVEPESRHPDRALHRGAQPVLQAGRLEHGSRDGEGGKGSRPVQLTAPGHKPARQGNDDLRGSLHLQDLRSAQRRISLHPQTGQQRRIGASRGFCEGLHVLPTVRRRSDGPAQPDVSERLRQGREPCLQGRLGRLTVDAQDGTLRTRRDRSAQRRGRVEGCICGGGGRATCREQCRARQPALAVGSEHEHGPAVPRPAEGTTDNGPSDADAGLVGLHTSTFPLTAIGICPRRHTRERVTTLPLAAIVPSPGLTPTT